MLVMVISSNPCTGTLATLGADGGLSSSFLSRGWLSVVLAAWGKGLGAAASGTEGTTGLGVVAVGVTWGSMAEAVACGGKVGVLGVKNSHGANTSGGVGGGGKGNSVGGSGEAELCVDDGTVRIGATLCGIPSTEGGRVTYDKAGEDETVGIASFLAEDVGILA